MPSSPQCWTLCVMEPTARARLAGDDKPNGVFAIHAVKNLTK